MSTRLLLMRHAKSSWKVAGQSDHQRPLNKRGRQDAPRMAQQLRSRGWVPDLALVSDAARTEETWAWMAGELEPSPPHVLHSGLYHGTLREIRAAISSSVTTEGTVLVLGHNPGWEAALTELSGVRASFTTANIALLEHPLSWTEAMQRSDWQLRALLRPREPRQ